MQKLQEKMKELLPPAVFANWNALLPALEPVIDIDSKFSRSARVRDLEELCDCMCEFMYALLFLSLGFEVKAEPTGDKGPDFAVSRDGRNAMLECTRFRHIHSGPPVSSLNDPQLRAGFYGDLERDTRKALQKIMGKFPQVEGNNALIAIWNDDGDLEELEVSDAVHQLRIDADAGRFRLPTGLQAVIYGSDWKQLRDRKQIYCFETRRTEPHLSEWLEELKALDVPSTLAQLRQD